MDQAPSDAELAAYITGHLARNHTAEIERWMARDPAHAARVAIIRTLMANPAAEQWDRDRMWQTLQQTIAASAEPIAPPPTMRASDAIRIRAESRWIRRSLGVAAAAAVLIVAAGAVSVFRWRSGSAAERVYATHRGEHVTVQLADDSRVTLAPESELRVPANFGAHDRAVSLTGEAVFDVVHDPTHVFRVAAAHAQVVDVGTRFDLRAYPGDTVARVAVIEGAVTLGARSTAAVGTDPRAEGVLVVHGEVASLGLSGHARAMPIENDAAYFGWTAGRLVFARAPLGDVLKTVSRWYDIHVTIADPGLAARLVTAELSGQSADDVVRALARAVGTTVAGSAGSFTLGSR